MTVAEMNATVDAYAMVQRAFYLMSGYSEFEIDLLVIRDVRAKVAELLRTGFPEASRPL